MNQFLIVYYFDLTPKRLDQYSLTRTIFFFIRKQDFPPKLLKDEVNQTITDYMLAGITHNVQVFHTILFYNSIFQAMNAVFRENIQLYSDDFLVTKKGPDTISGTILDDKFEPSLRKGINILKDED